LDNFPIEIIGTICSYLGGKRVLASFCLVSSQLNKIIISPKNDSLIWKQLCKVDFNFDLSLTSNNQEGNDSKRKNIPQQTYREKWRNFYKWTKYPGRKSERFQLSSEEAFSTIQFKHGFGFGLYISDTLISFEFPGYWDGSLVRFFIKNKGNQDSIKEEVNQIRFILNEGMLDPELSLQQQFWPFLRLFSPGNYNLDLNYDLHPRRNFPPFIDYQENNIVATAYFYEVELDDDRKELCRTDMLNTNYFVHPTQSLQHLKPERIAFYREQIKQKKFPIILALRVNFDELYILDGHHKYVAYREEENINPVILTITPIIFFRPTFFKKPGCDWEIFCQNCCNWNKPSLDFFLEKKRNEEEIQIFEDRPQHLPAFIKAYDFFINNLYKHKNDKEDIQLEEAQFIPLYCEKDY